MKPLIYICLGTVLLVPFPLLGQNFGCYETPTTTTASRNVLDENAPSRLGSEPIVLDSFKVMEAKDGDYKEYYKTRPYYPMQLRMAGKIVNSKQEGTWTLHLKDNSTTYIGNYVNGLKEGKWKATYINFERDTVTNWIGTFVHNKLEGLVQRGFYEKGKICWELYYSNGLLNGLAKHYLKDGRVSNTTFYRDGKKNGKEMEYGDGGRVKSIINYKDDKKNGEKIEYADFSSSKSYPNKWNYNLPSDTTYKPISIEHYINDTLSGSAMVTGWEDIRTENYTNGMLDGKCTYYYTNTGNIEKSIDYSKGVLSGEYSKYYQNGQLAFTVMCKNGLPYTSVSANSADGKVLDPGTLKGGNGTLNCYYHNGQLRSTHTYKNQCIYGSFASYYENGKIKENGELYSVKDSSKQFREYLIDNDDFNIYASRNMKYFSGKGRTISEDSSKELYESINQDTSKYNQCFHEKNYYPNNKLSSDYYTKNNLIVGTANYYYENGQVEAVENNKILRQAIKKSLKDGLCRYYFKTGKIKAEVYYTNGMESGHSKYYDEAGNLMREHYVFSNGIDYNVFIGDTVNRIDKNGMKQGKWISFDDLFHNSYSKDENDCNINPETIKFFKNNEPIGVWEESSSNIGGDSAKLIWIDSIKAQYYGYDGDKLEYEGYVLDECHPVGHWKEYNTDCKKPYLEWEGDFGNDHYLPEDTRDREGEWKHYKKNGKIKEILIYRDGEEISPIPSKK